MCGVHCGGSGEQRHHVGRRVLVLRDADDGQRPAFAQHGVWASAGAPVLSDYPRGVRGVGAGVRTAVDWMKSQWAPCIPACGPFLFIIKLVLFSISGILVVRVVSSLQES